MANRIQYQVDFNVNQSGLKQLRSSLQSLQKVKFSDLMKINNTDINAARKTFLSINEDVEKVGVALTKAFNTKLNTVNIETFNQELNKSGLTMEQVYSSFSRGGAAGEAAFRQLTAQVLNTNTQLRQSQTLLDKMAVTLGNSIKWNISSSLVNSFTRSIQQAWGYAKSLDTALNDIRIVTGKSSEQMGRFAEKANDAAQSLGKTTNDYTKAALIFAQQGLSDEEIEARTMTTLKASNVTGESASKVSEQLTAVWNGFNVATSKTEETVDKIAAVASTSASSLGELSAAMGKVASAANSMGVTEEQLIAQLSTIISVTREAPESVGAALRTVYARISDINAGIDEQGVTLGRYSGKMAELGISVLDESGKLRDMGEVMEEIGNSWGNLTREQQVYLAQTMAGQRQYNNLLALFDNFSQYNKELQIAKNGTGTLQEQQDIYMESTKAHLNELTAAMQNIYDSFIDNESINTLIDGLTTAANVTASLIDAFGGGGNVLTMLGTIGFNVFSKQIANSLETVIRNYENVNAQAQIFNDKLAAAQAKSAAKNPLGDSYTQQIVDRFAILGDLAPNMNLEDLTTANQLLTKLAETSGEYDIVSEKLLMIQQSMQGVRDKAEDLGYSVEDLDTLLSSPQGLEILRESLQNLKTEFLSFNKDGLGIEKIFNNLEKSIKNNSDKVESYFTDLKQKINDFFNSLNENKNGSGSLFDFLPESAQKAVTDAEKIFNNLSGNNSITLEQFNNLKQSFSNVTQSISNEVHKLNGLINDTKNEEVEGLQERKAALESLVKQYQTLFGVIESRAKNFTIMDTTKLVSGFSQVTSAMNQFSRVIDIINDKNSSFLEKTVQIMINLGTSVPMMLNGYKNLTEQLNKYAQVSKIAAAEKLKEATASETVTAADVAQAGASKGAAAENVEQAAAAQAAAAANTAQGAAAAGAVAPTTALGAAAAFLSANLLPIIAIVAGIVVAVKVFDAITVSIEQADQNLKQLHEDMQNFNNSSKENSENVASLQEMASEFKNLSSIAGDYDKNINNLSEEQKKRYNEIKDKIIELDETAVAYYDNEGNAILRNNYDLQDTIDLLKQKHEEEAKQLYSGKNAKTIDDSYMTKFNEARRFRGNQSQQAQYSQQKNLNTVYLQQQLATLNQQKNVSKQAIQQAQKARLELDNALKSGQKVTEAQVKNWKNIITNAFQPNDPSLKNVDSYFNALIKNLDKNADKLAEANDKLETASQIDVNWILGRIKYDDVYNKGYEQLKALGIQNAEALLEGYAEGLKLGVNGLQTPADIYNAVNDFAIKLANNMQAVGGPEEVNKIINNYFDEYLKATEDAKVTLGQASEQFDKMIYQFINSAKGRKLLEGLNPEQIKNSLKNYFPDISDLDIDENKRITNITAKYQKMIQQAWDAINTSLSQQTFSKGREGLNIVDKIAETMPQIEDLSREQAQIIIKYQQYIVEETLKNGGDFQKALETFTNIDEALDTSSLDNLINSFAKLEGEARSTALPIYCDNLLELTKDFKNAAEEAETLQRLMHSTNEAAKEMAAQDLAIAGKAGQLGETFNLDAEDIENQVRIFKLEKEYAKMTAAEIANAAVEQLRFNRGVESLNKNLQTWKDTLKKISKGELPFTVDLMKDLQQVYGDILNQDGTKLGADFLKSADNLQLLEDYLNGVDGAYEKLARNSIDLSSIVDPSQLDSVKSELESFFEQLDTLDDGVSIGDNIKISDNLQQVLTDWVNRCADTAQQASQMLSDIGIDAPVIESSAEVTDTPVESTGEVLETGWTMIPGKVTVNSSIKTANFTGTQGGIPQFTQGPTIETGGSMPQFTPVAKSVTAPTEKKESVPTFEIKFDEAKKGSGGGSVKRKKGTPIKSNNKTGKGGRHGGGGGGGGGGKSNNVNVSKVDRSKPQRDIYRKVNASLKKYNREYDKLGKNQDKLFGKELVTNLQKQNELLDKQIKKLKQKQKIQQKDLENQKKALKQEYGLKVDKNGDIANYDKVVKAYDDKIAKRQKDLNKYLQKHGKYNKKTGEYELSEKENKKFEEDKKQLEKWKKQLSNILSAVGDWDKLKEQINNVIDESVEYANKKIENNVKVFDLQIEYRLNTKKAKLDWYKFERDVKNRQSLFSGTDFENIENDYGLANKNARYYFKQGNHAGIIQEITDKLKDVTREYDKVINGGTSYLGDKETIMEEMNKLYEQLIENLGDFQAAVEEMEQQALNYLDAIAEEFNKRNESFEYINQLLNHDMNMLTLLYGEKNYKSMMKYYQAMRKNNEEQVVSLTAEYNYWKKMKEDALKEQSETGVDNTRLIAIYDENMKNSLSTLNSTLEKSAQLLKQEYVNTVKDIFDTLDKEITNQFGSDYLQTEWDLLGKDDEDYLDTINRAYAIQETERKYLKALDEDNISNQSKLKTLMQEQLQILKEKENLTQYDVDRAEKLLQIEQARIALQNAQSAKTTMRLRRDAQGNYSYQYVADQSKVEDAVDNLAKAKNELYNFDKDAYKSNLNDILTAWRDFQTEYAEIAEDNSLTDGQREKKQLLLREKYGERINKKVADNERIRLNLSESAFDEYSDLYNVDMQTFEKMTDEEKKEFLENLVPAMKSGIQQMATTIAGRGGFTEVCKKAFDQLDQATKDFKNNIEALGKAAGKNFEDLKNDIDAVTQSFINAVPEQDKFTEQINTRTDAVKNFINQIRELVKKWMPQYNKAVNQVDETAPILVKQNKNGGDAAAKQDDKNREASQVKPTASIKKTVGNGKILTASYSLERKALDESEKNYVSKRNQQISEEFKKNPIKAIQMYGSPTAAQNKIYDELIQRRKSKAEAQLNTQEIWFYNKINQINKIINSGASSTSTTRLKTLNKYGRTPKEWEENVYKEILKNRASMATGGYTGDWADNQGRLALLHKKELVLNQTDTQNLLNSISILRDMMSNLDNRMMLQMSATRSTFDAAPVQEQQLLTQSVHIEASFPAVNSKKEIEDALSDLVNRAAQRANSLR